MEKTVHVQTKSMKETFTPEPILDPIVKKFPQKKESPLFSVIAIAVVLFLGVGTGWAFAKKSTTTTSNTPATVTTSNSVNTTTEAGINDSSAFPDSAQGILTEGGIGGEGTHHLDRGMGAAKDVYLTSTVINLQSFVGKKVEVQGQTISGKKAGWLMDVGKVKVIE